MSQVVAMLQRKSGATLVEIMETMAWQRHTVRGFVAGALKKAGTPSNPSSPKVGSGLTASSSSDHLISPKARPAPPWRAFLLRISLSPASFCSGLCLSCGGAAFGLRVLRRAAAFSAGCGWLAPRRGVLGLEARQPRVANTPTHGPSVANERGPNVAQRWPSVGGLAAVATPHASRPERDTAPANRCGHPVSDFDSRNLGLTARDSFVCLVALLSNFFERPPICLESRFPARQILPSGDNGIHVLRIQLDPVTDPLGGFRGCQSSAASEKGLVHRFAALGVIQQRAPHQIHRLLRWMIVLLLIGAAHDEFGRRAGPDRGILARLAEPGSILFPDIPAGLMLKPIVRACKNSPPLVPNNLLVV